MNEFLKFSWSHIFTFLAVILLGYFSFLGASYWTDGNFMVAGIITAVIVLVLIFWFVTAQMLKGTSGRVMKLKKSIVFERALIFTCPVVFILSLGPLFHFWNVHSHNDEIVSTFKQGINASTGIFTHYEQYAEQRTQRFASILAQGKTASASSLYGGLSSKDEQEQMMNQALTDKLTGTKYQELRQEANRWIQEANQEPSIWNVFLLGNIDEIKKSMEKWRNQLVELSTPVLKAEQGSGSDVKLYDDDKGIINGAVGILNRLESYYAKMEAPKPAAIGLALLIFFLLLFPYLLQARHSKSTYRLLGKRKSMPGMSMDPVQLSDVVSANDTPNQETTSQQSGSSTDTTDDFGMFSI